jgi:xylulokinase
MRRADLVGHLNTFLHRTLTGNRVTDPSNASFMGLYRTLDLGGWSEQLCEAVGISPERLPDVRDADEIGGSLHADGARALGLPRGTPMLVGLTDTGSAMLLAGARRGQLLNVSGSTDVLALCTDRRPRPHERLLTRALGVGRRWLSVSTLASAGSTIRWVHEQLFADLSWASFEKELARAARRASPEHLRFEPYLAGDRTSIEQRRGAFAGMTLATTRLDMLAAVIDALARAGGERLDLLRSAHPITLRAQVLVSGGMNDSLARVLRREWKGNWRFRNIDEATLRGLAFLVET